MIDQFRNHVAVIFCLCVFLAACGNNGSTAPAPTMTPTPTPSPTPTPAASELSMFAGTGPAGVPIPGPAIASTLNDPFGVATDSTGNVYIADLNNNVVEKITLDGVLSIFAGIVGSGGTPVVGPATHSPLNNPTAVATDGLGNVYIVDYNNNVIELVNSAGNLSIFAGNGKSGTPTAGAATSSSFSFPMGIAVDNLGNVYVADTSNYLIEKITPSGNLNVFAGNGTQGMPIPGPALSSPLSFPSGVATDNLGNVYVADYNNNLIEKIDSSGNLSVFAGNGLPGTPAPGVATLSPLYGPLSLAADGAGNVYIADVGNALVEEVSANGILTVFAGNGTSGVPVAGLASASPLSGPVAVAVDTLGHVYIANSDNSGINMVVKTTPVQH